MSFYYFAASFLFSSRSCASSSTTACAMTLDAKAARAAGVAGPEIVALSMSSSRLSMRREISACTDMSSKLKSLNALNFISLTVIVVCFSCVVVGGAPNSPRHCGQAERLRTYRGPCQPDAPPSARPQLLLVSGFLSLASWLRGDCRRSRRCLGPPRPSEWYALDPDRFAAELPAGQRCCGSGRALRPC